MVSLPNTNDACGGWKGSGRMPLEVIRAKMQRVNAGKPTEEAAAYGAISSCVWV